MTFSRFDYLHFAIDELGGAAHPLGLSGATELTEERLRELGGELAESADYTSGGALFPVWREQLAERYGVPAEHISHALGASGGVFLALSAALTLTEGPVAIEAPAYGVFEACTRFHGRTPVALPRAAEEAYALDLARVEAAFAAGARVLCLTDLHNPSGVRLSQAEVDGVAELAEEYDAWVVLDEVYRDFLREEVGTAYRADGRIVCVSSLTKVYGLSAPRLGWITAPDEFTRRVAEVRAITHGVDPVPSLAHAVRALSIADALRKISLRTVRRARPVMDGWIEREERASWVPPEAGLTGLVRIEGLADSLEFARELRHELDVQVVPGSFFGAEGHLRISFGLPPAALQRALDLLSMGIGALLR